MNTRNLSVIVIAIMLTACVVPMAIDESDGATHTRISQNYVIYAQFEKQEAYDEWYHEWYNTDYLYFIDGSDLDNQMKRYIEDPLNVNIDDDQREAVENAPTGTKINVYALTSYYSDYSGYTIGYNDQSKEGTKLLDPFNDMTFFVKAGDTLRLTIDSMTPMYTTEMQTEPPRAYVYTDRHYDIDPSLTLEFTKSSEISVQFENTYCTLYVDVVYDVSGISTPNGSATVYIAICAAITVLVLALLVMAGRKPKWSK